MITGRRAAAALSALCLAACAGTPAAITSRAEPPHAAGYLSASRLEALAQAVPAPPGAGSAQVLADRAASDRLRRLQGGDRWLLATAHAEIRPPLALQHFDCALGVRVAGQPAPALNRLAQKLFHDADSVAEQVKARAARPRPVGDDPEREACQRLTPAARASASYPSGTSSIAVAWAEALAEVEPERAEAVRRIGHEIGVSRQVCAMHYPSDVAAGEAVGRAVVQAARLDPDFQADVTAARAELAAMRATGLTNAGCAAEARTLALPLP